MAKKSDGMVNLGKEYTAGGPCCVDAPKSATPAKKGEKYVTYPTLYVGGITGLDLATGEVTFTGKGKIVSVTDRKSAGKDDNYSFEMEVHAIKFDGPASAGGLEEALDNIAKKKK